MFLNLKYIDTALVYTSILFIKHLLDYYVIIGLLSPSSIDRKSEFTLAAIITKDKYFIPTAYWLFEM
jgi:hypothetical protein